MVTVRLGLLRFTVTVTLGRSRFDRVSDGQARPTEEPDFAEEEASPSLIRGLLYTRQRAQRRMGPGVPLESNQGCTADRVLSGCDVFSSELDSVPPWA